MTNFILFRLLLVIPVVLGATMLVFAIVQFAPGDPAQAGTENQAEAVSVHLFPHMHDGPAPAFENRPVSIIKVEFGHLSTLRIVIVGGEALRVVHRCTRHEAQWARSVGAVSPRLQE